MYKLKLIKGLSYNGIVSATVKNPYVNVDNEETALAAVETGYFKIVEYPKNDDSKNKDWKKLNKDELIAFANEQGIDVSACKNKEERIALIETALADNGTNIEDIFNS